MIVTKLKGGLGNQMFQYAAGRALAVKHRTSLYLDLSFLLADTQNQYTKRNFELDQLNIQAGIADQELLKKFDSSSRLKRWLGLTKKVLHNTTGYDPAFESISDNVCLDGFWQSEKYFNNVREILLEEFKPSYEFSQKEKSILDEMQSCNSVAVHVRRGDYITLKSANEFHGICDMDYYKKAISFIQQKVPDPVFFIFSDEPQWCRQNFTFSENLKVIDNQNEKSSADLLLMTHAKNNIIANSSYSWWAAWLNRNSDKTVVAPKKWFAALETPELLPPAFIKL